MEIALIGDRHTVYGFRLAGIRKTFLIEQIRQEDIRGVLNGLFDDNIGIILVTEKVAEEIRHILEEVGRFRKGIMPSWGMIPQLTLLSGSFSELTNSSWMISGYCTRISPLSRIASASASAMSLIFSALP